MKTNAAILTERNAPWEIVELDVRDPKAGEVLIRYTAAGLCHSDLHLVTGDLPSPLPYIGGHEGAGIIEAVGPGGSKGAKGNNVVGSFIPACGMSSWCSQVLTSLCDMSARILDGYMPDGSYGSFLD